MDTLYTYHFINHHLPHSLTHSLTNVFHHSVTSSRFYCMIRLNMSEHVFTKAQAPYQDGVYPARIRHIRISGFPIFGSVDFALSDSLFRSCWSSSSWQCSNLSALGHAKKRKGIQVHKMNMPVCIRSPIICGWCHISFTLCLCYFPKICGTSPLASTWLLLVVEKMASHRSDCTLRIALPQTWLVVNCNFSWTPCIMRCFCK